MTDVHQHAPNIPRQQLWALQYLGDPYIPRFVFLWSVRRREYNNWLITQAGCPQPLPAWRGDMYAATGRNKRAHPDDYRCAWP